MSVSVENGPWPLRPVGEICEVLDRLRKPVNSAERANRVGPYPYFGANGQVGVIDDFIFDEELVLVAEDGGFFFDPLRPIAYRVSGKCWVNNHAHVLRCKDGIDPDWLCLAIAYQDISQLVKGATRPKLNQKELREILVPAPPPEEQVLLLGRIQECMAKCDEIQKLRAESLDASSSLPNSVRHDLWDDAMSEFGMTTLGDLAASTKNGLYKPKRFHGSGTVLLRMFNVNGGRLVLDRIERLEVSDDEADKYGLSDGDIIVSRVNSRELVGKSALIRGLQEAAVFEAMLMRLSLHPGISPIVVCELMNAPQFLHDLRGRAKHAIGQSSINQGDLLSTHIPDVRKADQDQLAEDISSRLGHAFNAGENLANIPEHEHLRTAILRRAFAGEL